MELVVFSTRDKSALKERLDHIDNVVYNTTYKSFKENRKRVLIGIWEKGRQIGESVVGKAGGNPTTNWHKMSRDTGRDRPSLVRWYRIYKKHPSLELYEPIAEEEAELWTQQRAIEESSKKALVLKHTGNQENYTPQYIIDPVKRVLGEIDLDPASCELAQEKIKAKRYFTEEDDGLSKKWGGTVFLNPPYQTPLIGQFADKMVAELENIKSAIMLTNNNTDTRWFHKLANNAKAICFTSGRINFYTESIEETQPTNGQCFFYFGDSLEKFIDVFKEIGIIMMTVKVDG